MTHFLGRNEVIFLATKQRVRVPNSQWNSPIQLIDPSIDVRQPHRPRLSGLRREPRLPLGNLSRSTFRKPLQGTNGIALAARAPPLPVGVAAIGADPRESRLPFLLVPDYVQIWLLRIPISVAAVSVVTDSWGGEFGSVGARGRVVNRPSARGGFGGGVGMVERGSGVKEVAGKLGKRRE